jgi:hypothetical protein
MSINIDTMRWTNKHDLPHTIVNAITNDSYSRGDCDYTVSELQRPPRIHALSLKHKEEIEEDVIDHLWILIGKSVHTILERSVNYGVAERRLYARVGEHVVGGGMDYYHASGLLQDYKITNTTKIKFKDYTDWEAQLNCYRYILDKCGEPVNRLQIVAILRDWTKSQTKWDLSYPRKQIEIIDIPLWTLEDTEKWILEKIDGLKKATEKLPLCTDKDRWANARNKWTRCEGYCSVRRFCDQYNGSKVITD